MHIAYICADTGVPVFENKGASIHVREMLRALRRWGADVELFAARLGQWPSSDLEDMKIHCLPAVPNGDPSRRERAAMINDSHLWSALAKAGPFDLVYERYSLWSQAGMSFAQSRHIPSMLEVNAPLVEEQARYRQLVNRAAAEYVAERVFCGASALLAVSEQLANYLKRFPVEPGRVHVVPNGVDFYRFRPDAPAAMTNGSGVFTVGFVGSLKPWHDLDTLVDAVSVLRRSGIPVRLIVVGDGPARPSLEARLATHELHDCVTLVGPVDSDEIPHWLASFDAAVAPYPLIDPFYFSPIKVFEYMASGLPVVASRLGQLAELIQDGVNGMLVPPGDAAALAEALTCLAADPKLRATLGQAGRDYVRRHHTWDRIAARILDVASAVSADCQLAADSTLDYARV